MLTHDEKDAASILRTSAEEITSQSDSASSLTMAERFVKKRKVEASESSNINCDFILGSVAEVERLRSLSKYVLTENRRGMTPELFEAITFLRVNDRFLQGFKTCFYTNSLISYVSS